MSEFDVKIIATDEQVRSLLFQIIREQADQYKEVVLKSLKKELPDLIFDVTEELRTTSNTLNPIDLIPRKVLAKKWEIRDSSTWINWEAKGILKPYKIGDLVFYHKDEVQILEKVINNKN